MIAYFEPDEDLYVKLKLGSLDDHSQQKNESMVIISIDGWEW